jgi:hypothetical protein
MPICSPSFRQKNQSLDRNTRLKFRNRAARGTVAAESSVHFRRCRYWNCRYIWIAMDAPAAGHAIWSCFTIRNSITIIKKDNSVNRIA